MAVSYHDRPFRFFDLPREIRNDIYTRMTSFYDDFSMITLGPKGRLPNYIGKPSDHRAGLYKRYQEFVSLFTISRQFRDEALPIFWQGNEFDVSFEEFNVASKPELPEPLDQVNTVLGFIPLSGKMYITRIRVRVLCTVFVKKPGGSQKNAEYDTDLGVTIEALLEMMPKLQRLDISFFCEFERKNYPGRETTTAVLEGAAGSLLEFLYPIQILEAIDPTPPMIDIGGNVAGRPVRAAKEQGTRV